MTLSELTPLLAQYHAALDAQIALLEQLQALAGRQRETLPQHATTLDDVVDERERVMTALVTLESEVQPLRRTLAAAKDQLMHLEEFREVVAMHRHASTLVEEIVRNDADSREALREAEIARRTAAESVEKSESTLAAYRRVVMPSIAAATLVNRKG